MITSISQEPTAMAALATIGTYGLIKTGQKIKNIIDERKVTRSKSFVEQVSEQRQQKMQQVPVRSWIIFIMTYIINFNNLNLF